MLTVTCPNIRYHGGKWKFAPWSISHFPRHRVYLEPFGGAASLLLQKARGEVEIYSDLVNLVVSLFRVVRVRGHYLPIDAIKKLRDMVIVSMYDDQIYPNLLSDWKKVSCQTSADGSAMRTEILWLSPSAARSIGAQMEPAA